MLNAPLYPVGTIAKLFNLSERRVQQLASQGVIPKSEKGQYNFLAALRGYILFLQQRSERQSSTQVEEADLEQARLRLMTAQAEKAEHANQVLRGQWIETRIVNQALQEVGTVFTACVDALPGRLAVELTNINDPAVIKSKLFAACRELRNATGQQLQALAAAMQHRQEDGAEDQGAATEDTGSVGGQ